MKGPILLLVVLAFGSGCGEERTPASALSPEPAEVAPLVPSVPEPTGTAPATDPPEIARPYEEGVDAAVSRAHADGKRVLLMFGANWCVWCRRLSWVFENEPSVRAALADGWHVVHVDTGTRGSPTNAALVQRYGNPLQHGLPCLVVLDGAGQLVHTQETGSLESGDRHDPARVLAFLTRFRRAEPR
jgi:thiol:disulfide interchange protein